MIAQSQGRLQDRNPIAIIDIGSNSIRLVVYEGIARSPTVLFNEKMLAGLGRGIVSTGKLDPEAVTRAIEEFRRFRALAEQAGAREFHVIATAAAREAINGPDFIKRAEEILGTPIRVLTGREEAYYSALGVISGFHPANGIAGDLGGGSLELVDVEGENIGDGITLPLGGLRLQDMSKNSPILSAKIARDELAKAKLLKGGRGRVFYAVGGTWRNLARLHMNVVDYPLNVMHHYELGAESSLPFLRQIAKGDIDKMKGIEGVSKNRRTLLPYGAAVMLEIIAAMAPSKIVVSALGVREGFLFSLLSLAEQRQDPLISASEELALLRARSVTHAHELAQWTGMSFAAFGIDETEEEAALSACRLPAGRHRLARPSRISRASVTEHHCPCVVHRRRSSGQGVSRARHLFPARGHLQRDGSRQHRGAGDATLSRACAAARRHAARGLSVVGFNAWRHSKAAMGDRGNGSLALVLPAELAGLDGERPAGRLAQLAKVTGRKLELAVEEPR